VMALADEDRVTLGLHKGTEPEAPPSAGDRARDADIIANGLAHCARLGITSMTNMDGNRYTLEVLRDLHGQGRLTARVKVPYHHQNWRDPADLDQASALARDFDGDWVSSGFVKAFLDGVGESYTAALLDDYPDRPGWNGELLFSPAAFAALATDVDRRGLQMAVHAVGDRAVQVALDGYQAAALVNGRRDARHRIEHIELISDADIPRLAALGVIASVQPCHVPGAMDFPPVDLAGPTAGFRWKGAYLHRTLAEAGAKMCFASDWPVADANPLRGIQSALERPVLEDGPDDRVTLHDALAAYTSGAAYAEHREDRKGRLSPGFLADIVILDGDIERVATADIGAMGLARTITGGRTVWQA
jgi:predicted amidohydrolase YtcJ